MENQNGDWCLEWNPFRKKFQLSCSHFILFEVCRLLSVLDPSITKYGNRFSQPGCILGVKMKGNCRAGTSPAEGFTDLSR